MGKLWIACPLEGAVCGKTFGLWTQENSGALSEGSRMVGESEPLPPLWQQRRVYEA